MGLSRELIDNDTLQENANVTIWLKNSVQSRGILSATSNNCFVMFVEQEFCCGNYKSHLVVMATNTGMVVNKPGRWGQGRPPERRSRESVGVRHTSLWRNRGERDSVRKRLSFGIHLHQ